MERVYHKLCFIILFLAACNPVKRITGSKQNGSNYILTIESNHDKKDSVIVTGTIRVVGSASGENMAARGLQVLGGRAGNFRKLIQPDDAGNFSCTLAPGTYSLFFGGIGFGKMKTEEFTLRPGESAKLNAVLYPEEEVMDHYIETPYRTVPRRNTQPAPK